MKNKKIIYATLLVQLLVIIGLLYFYFTKKVELKKVEVENAETEKKQLDIVLKSCNFIQNQDIESYINLLNEAKNNKEESQIIGFLEFQLSNFLQQDSLQERMTQENYELLLKIGDLNKKLNSTVKIASISVALKDSLETELTILASNLEEKKEIVNVLNDSLSAVSSSVGKLNFKNELGKEVSYYGKIVNGEANGYGVGVYDNKGIYQGEWKGNLRNGKGKYIWNNGDQFVGEYVNGKREGAGNYYFISGERYEGGWKSDLRHGYGTVYSKDGKILAQGEWENDKLVKKVTG